MAGRAVHDCGGSCRSFEATHCDEVFVSDCTNVSRAQFDQRLRLTGSSHELHVEPIRIIHGDNRT